MRVDLALVERGLAKSREEAQRLVLAGEVRIGDRLVAKPSEGAAPADVLAVEPRASRFVSRGGDKLAGALETFSLEPKGLVALDVGASTGGFTDCLLRAGAARVYTVDVGYGQLDWKLRNDPRVRVIERQNARELGPHVLPELVDLATIDVSFISLRLVLPAVVSVLRPGGEIVALVKPQFEVGKGQVGKGGVVRDPALHACAVESVRRAAEELGLEETGFSPSALLGPKGNREFFLALRRSGPR